MISFIEIFGNIYSAFLRKGRISLVSGETTDTLEQRGLDWVLIRVRHASHLRKERVELKLNI